MKYNSLQHATRSKINYKMVYDHFPCSEPAKIKLIQQRSFQTVLYLD